MAAEALAIWGAVTGTAALGPRIFEFLRDRPKLSVSANARVTLDTPASIAVHVANNGRQPTTITEAGFVVAVEYEFRNQRWEENRPSDVALPTLRLSSGSVLVPPGEVAEFKRELTQWPPNVAADFPLRGYAIDSRNRTWWGAPIPLLRRLLDVGWRPPEGTPPELLEPAGIIDARPVAPRWKIWTPKGHRMTRPSQQDRTPTMTFSLPDEPG